MFCCSFIRGEYCEYATLNGWCELTACVKPCSTATNHAEIIYPEAVGYNTKPIRASQEGKT